MKTISKYLAALGCLVVAMMVTGCGAMVQNTEYKTRLVTPSDAMLQLSDQPTPPDRIAYVAATWEQREFMLTTFAQDQIAAIASCNGRIQSVIDWKREQKVLFKQTE